LLKRIQPAFKTKQLLLRKPNQLLTLKRQRLRKKLPLQRDELRRKRCIKSGGPWPNRSECLSKRKELLSMKNELRRELLRNRTLGRIAFQQATG
jgi:hypothetical protein